jgi:hypothetical protein
VYADIYGKGERGLVLAQDRSLDGEFPLVRFLIN